MRRYTVLLVVVDFIAMYLAVTVGYLTRFGFQPAEPASGIPYWTLALFLYVGWIVAMYGSGAYEIRRLGIGSEEFRRVVVASLVLFGGVAMVCYSLQILVARGFVAVVFPVGVIFLMIGRFGARKWLHGRRAAGRCAQRILAVGNRESVGVLVEQARTTPMAGFKVVGCCTPDRSTVPGGLYGVPWVGRIEDAAIAAAELDVDVVAVTTSPAVTPATIRQLGWDLEGTGRELVLAPGLTNVAGPRMSVHPVAGMALLYVDEPEFTGLSRLLKRAVDIVGALAALVVALPFLVLIAAAIKATSPGPVIFRQLRTGIGGEEFQVLKFRSMYADAASRRESLLSHNECDGHLFKMRRDPRVTPVGRLMRRLSIDEVPQLLNVLIGHMSLVGPRPLFVEDSTYSGHARRRLLVRPGITGLWQVSGRSNLSWDDVVRLDLEYVENWSLALDFVILARTGIAVLRGVGAY